jgi:hypothetical protein
MIPQYSSLKIENKIQTLHGDDEFIQKIQTYKL